jgi:hypothetical protein
VLGFVPTGWYPTAVKELSDGTLAVLNGRGLRSYPNPKARTHRRKPRRPTRAFRRCNMSGASRPARYLWWSPSTPSN